jgi:gag-polyprotein putative aspartyl protease
MPHVAFQARPDGLLVDVVIGFDAKALRLLQLAGQPIPQPVQVRGLLDTGADATAISAACAKRLSLAVVGTVSTHTAAGSLVVNQFSISLSILGAHKAGLLLSVSPELTVTEWLDPPSGLDALVGLDVLSQGLLIYDGPGQQFTLAF